MNIVIGKKQPFGKTVDVGDSIDRINTRSLKVSVIIPNYNYEQFVGATIDSALAIDWPNVEVIVVDDGSTDGSRAVIKRYADRVTTIFQENAGQLIACSNGFAQSKGDLILFLDSDDLVDPSIIREAVAVSRPGVSKVQFQMQTIDAVGNSLGSFHPQYKIIPTSDQIRRWLINTTSYPSPPGSGNIYSRDLVKKVFQVCPAIHDTFSDSALLTAAPFFGDVIVVDKPLVFYRIHGRNDGTVTSLDAKRLRGQLEKAMARSAYAKMIGNSLCIRIGDQAMFQSLSILPYRLASFCLTPALHPIHADSRMRILFDMVRAAFIPQGLPVQSIVTWITWTLLVVMSPNSIAKFLILWRFAPTTRPKALQRFLCRIGVLR
jgi:glycosyltransferase involved in cell wall biosynthesis